MIKENQNKFFNDSNKILHGKTGPSGSLISTSLGVGQEIVSITYEEIGFFPRSFSRVLDRFLKQVFSDVENLVIQEYRFYRYLFLTTLKCLIILFFVPFLVNFFSKNYLVRPLTEYFWNTQQNEIFLNTYQQKRAFAELKDFEEKIYFESLINFKEIPTKSYNKVSVFAEQKPTSQPLSGREGYKSYASGERQLPDGSGEQTKRYEDIKRGPIFLPEGPLRLHAKLKKKIENRILLFSIFRGSFATSSSLDNFGAVAKLKSKIHNIRGPIYPSTIRGAQKDRHIPMPIFLFFSFATVPNPAGTVFPKFLTRFSHVNTGPLAMQRPVGMFSTDRRCSEAGKKEGETMSLSWYEHGKKLKSRNSTRCLRSSPLACHNVVKQKDWVLARIAPGPLGTGSKLRSKNEPAEAAMEHGKKLVLAPQLRAGRFLRAGSLLGTGSKLRSKNEPAEAAMEHGKKLVLAPQLRAGRFLRAGSLLGHSPRPGRNRPEVAELKLASFHVPWLLRPVRFCSATSGRPVPTGRYRRLAMQRSSVKMTTGASCCHFYGWKVHGKKLKKKEGSFFLLASLPLKSVKGRVPEGVRLTGIKPTAPIKLRTPSPLLSEDVGWLRNGSPFRNHPTSSDGKGDGAIRWGRISPIRNGAVDSQESNNRVLLEPQPTKRESFEQRLQEKTIELALRYNNQSIEAITNFFADLISFITLCYLLFALEIQINITKSFLLEVFFGLDDSKKSLLILLITDLLVGYHSSNLWELFFEFLFTHYGLPESQTGIFLLVATLPVLLDVLFKYLIFRHLNRSSPATVATYHAMIE